MSRSCGLLVFLCFVAGSANEALAQSPFAGTWSGTNTITGSQTCTFPPAGSIMTSCTGSAPWTIT
ncbi:MAG TPA: hypothetical protein VF386_03615, partial [Usitatibacter sp.]